MFQEIFVTRQHPDIQNASILPSESIWIPWIVIWLIKAMSVLRSCMFCFAVLHECFAVLHVLFCGLAWVFCALACFVLQSCMSVLCSCMFCFAVLHECFVLLHECFVVFLNNTLEAINILFNWPSLCWSLKNLGWKALWDSNKISLHCKYFYICL